MRKTRKRSNIMYYVGVDIGGTNVKAGIVDENGKIVKEVLKYDLIKSYKVTLRDMTFTLGADKLPAGTYTFKLKAAIARGAWEIENFQFTVK